jgi:ribonucleoside-triphosphate reductase
MTARYGLPYFQNFLNSTCSPTRCAPCAVACNWTCELLKRGNGLFGSAEQTGSLGVVTINCARLGYLFAGDTSGLLQRLDSLMDMAMESLEIKRKVIQHLMDAGPVPYTKRYLGTLRNHFHLGLNGINEMMRNFTDDTQGITPKKGARSPCACSTMCAPPCCASRRKPVTSTTSKPRRPKAPPTASPRKTASATRTSCRPAA